MLFINRYSFLITAVVVLGVTAAVLLRDGLSRRDGLALAAIAGAFILSWLFIRPGPSTLAQTAAVEAALRSGQPTLIEFQSGY